MKIISINPEHTIDTHSVAFNVDNPPARDVMKKIKYGSLKISFKEDDGLLYVSSNSDEPPICKKVVQILGEKIIDAEKSVEDETTTAKLKHERLLDDVAKLTGLPIERSK